MKKKRTHIDYCIFSLAVVGAVLLSFVPVFSFSALAAGLTIQPVKISHTINPGETVSGVIGLSNASQGEEVNVEAKVEDFVPTAGTTNINFVGRAEGVTTVRDWIKLDVPSKFEFSSGEGKQISYTITAPPDAEPGSHFGVMFFKATKKMDTGQLRIGTEVGILIFVTIPGNHLQKGRVITFTGPKFIQESPVPFVFKFENTGTVHFEPKGKITIRNIFGKTVTELPVEGNAVLPSQVREILVSWEYAGMLIGHYTATLEIVGSDGENIGKATTSFNAVPLWYLGEFFASIIIIFFVLRFLKKKIKINITLNS